MTLAGARNPAHPTKNTSQWAHNYCDYKSNGYNVYSRHLKMLDINKWREWPFEIMWQRVDKLNSTTENFAKHSLHWAVYGKFNGKLLVWQTLFTFCLWASYGETLAWVLYIYIWWILLGTILCGMAGASMTRYVYNCRLIMSRSENCITLPRTVMLFLSAPE